MKRTGLAATALALLATISCPAAAQAGKVRGPIILNPERVKIDLFYSGANIEVRAEVPAGYQVAVRLMAPRERLELKRLGRKAGVLWMKTGNVTFERMPAVYQVLTSVPLANLGPQTLRAQWLLGYDSLVPDHATEAALRPELVRLKEHDGLFAVREGALERGGPGVLSNGPLLAKLTEAGEEPEAEVVHPPEVLRGTFRLPAGAPAGDYSVDVIGFKEQQAVILGTATLHVEHAGLVKAFRNLAIDHGLIYGIAACSIAIVVGLLTGLVFRPKSDEGH
jgi:hypothetical protein